MNAPAAQQAPAVSTPEFLEKWQWYRGLSDELQSLVLRTTTERTAAPGDCIARVGEPCTHWYGLTRGILQMYVVGPDGAQTTLYCMREGEWGGDGSLLKKEMRRYDLRPLTAARLRMVPAETFETLRRSSIEFNHFLCDIMNTRMGEFVGMLAASRLRGPEMQVARALLMLASNRREAQELPVAQHELALISGLSRQRVNMAISQFKRRGFVRTELHRGSLIVDVPRLRSYVMEDG